MTRKGVSTEELNGHVSPAEKLDAARRDRGWSKEELAWVLHLPVEQVNSLASELRITATLALRLEAALEIQAANWYAVAGLAMPDLWLLQDQMAGELATIRRHRCRLGDDRRDEASHAPGTVRAG